DRAARTASIVDDHLLAEVLRETLPDETRDDVGRAAGRERDDQTYGFGRIVARGGRMGSACGSHEACQSGCGGTARDQSRGPPSSGVEALYCNAWDGGRLGGGRASAASRQRACVGALLDLEQTGVDEPRDLGGLLVHECVELRGRAAADFEAERIEALVHVG